MTGPVWVRSRTVLDRSGTVMVWVWSGLGLEWLWDKMSTIKLSHNSSGQGSDGPGQDSPVTNQSTDLVWNCSRPDPDQSPVGRPLGYFFSKIECFSSVAVELLQEQPLDGIWESGHFKVQVNRNLFFFFFI